MSLEKSKYIDTLINTGADAMKNLYYVKFSRVDGNSLTQEQSQGLMVREGNLTLPTFTHTVDSKKFMTVNLDLAKPEIQGEKKISVKFRVDNNYKVYELLKDWEALHTNPTAGIVNTDISKDELRVDVYALNDTTDAFGENGTQMYSFRYCWVSDVPGLAYSYDNANAQSVTANIYFCDMIDYQNREDFGTR